MTLTSPLLPTQIETVAELRGLYRAAEARAARLRLLSEAGRDLAGAGADVMRERLDACVRRLAHFIGFAEGSISRDIGVQGLAIHAPGEDERPVAILVIPGFAALDDIADPEDRDAVRIHLHLLGSAIDRMDREAERSRLLDTLQERERRLEFVVGRLFSAQEDERRRVSRELHDGVAQRATALFRMLEAAGSDRVSGESVAAPVPLATIARDLVQELREVIAGLRPTILDDLGIGPAIHALVAQLRTEGFAIEEDIDAGDGNWPTTVETALYRVAQEAMSNVRKHAGGPCRVEVTLHVNPEGTMRRLRIRDYGGGAGLLPISDDVGQHIGIDVMRERMAAIGGELMWQPQPDGGVEVLATLADRP